MSRDVLVVAPNWLGDAVMALPAVAALRQHLSGGRVFVAARAGVDDLFRLSPDVAAVIPLSWRGGLFEAAALSGDATRLRESGADVAVLLPNSLASAWLVRRAGIAERWGYDTDARRLLLTRTVARPRGSPHQSEYYLHLLRECGVRDGAAFRLAVPSDTVASVRTTLAREGWDGVAPLVVLAPGAAYGTAKQWRLDHVASAAGALVERGSTVVLVGGRADASATTHVRALMPAQHQRATIDLAGRTTLAELAALFTLARACVSNDSGAMHLAAALSTPTVALFGPTIERETSPLLTEHGWVRVLTAPVWCRPCMLRECPIDHRCMSGISPQMVLRALGDLPSAPMTGSAR